MVDDVVVKKFMFTISSPDEFLDDICERTDKQTKRHRHMFIAILRTPTRGEVIMGVFMMHSDTMRPVTSPGE